MSAPRKPIDEQLRDAEDLVRRKNAEINALKRDFKDFRKGHDDAASIMSQVSDLLSYEVDAPAWATKPGREGTRGCPITLWSDWHYGEVINPKEIGGVNKYNASIAKKRVERLVSTTVDLCYNHMGRAKVEYPGIVVGLLGDMIGGAIHPELEATNDRTPQEAIFEVAELIIAGLRTLLDHFPHVWVVCVAGNHGRGTFKPRFKQRMATSNELVVYKMVQAAFAGDKRIDFLIPSEADAFFSVFGHRFMATHGDSLGVKGGDGIIGALGPIMRGTIKTHNSEAKIGRDFDTLLIGHWHQYIPMRSVICNNSLKGYDEYAKLALRAEYSRPSQALFFCHPEHGLTAFWEVYLEGRKKASKSAIVSWHGE